MASRVEKYYTEKQEMMSSSRSSRNARLYKQVYGKYEDLDNLPLEDNTDEIDMERLKELLLKNNEEKQNKEIREHLNVLEQKKRNIDEQKVYDINKILEKAKYENNKLKENTSTLPKIDKSILCTLQSTELSIPEIQEAKQKYEIEKKIEQVYQEEIIERTKEEKLSMTRELKYHNLVESNPTYTSEISEPNYESNLSLDLFSDLKPTGNTIITKPIPPESPAIYPIKSESDFHSSDTSDIDIIKTVPIEKESDFFTNSYEFSKKDFSYDEDFVDLNKKGSIWKVILLILTIIIFVGVITYFIIDYGIGIS